MIPWLGMIYLPPPPPPPPPAPLPIALCAEQDIALGALDAHAITVAVRPPGGASSSFSPTRHCSTTAAEASAAALTKTVSTSPAPSASSSRAHLGEHGVGKEPYSPRLDTAEAVVAGAAAAVATAAAALAPPSSSTHIWRAQGGKGAVLPHLATAEILVAQAAAVAAAAAAAPWTQMHVSGASVGSWLKDCGGDRARAIKVANGVKWDGAGLLGEAPEGSSLPWGCEQPSGHRWGGPSVMPPRWQMNDAHLGQKTVI